MAAPRQALNPATHSVGFTAKLVTVRSISADGKSAVCVDRQNAQATVPMLVQRSKGPLPAPGETWLLTQDLGIWLFAAIVATSSGQFLSSEGSTAGGTRVTISATAPAGPATGDIWVNAASGNAVFWWSGITWISAQFGTQAIADGAITRAKIAKGAITTAEISPAAGITASQVAFSATEIGGVRIFLGTSQPPAPGPGDLWINPDQGNAFSFWDGGRWTLLLLGAGAVAPGSMTSFQISPTAGIKDGQVDFTARDIGGITTSVSSAQPANPAIGDLWFDGTSSYGLKQWNGSAWVPYQFGTQAIQALSITAALIAANTITAAQIAAGTITATQIAAGTILASNIAAGTITATQIAANTITAAQIAANTITASQIAANTITASQIAAGTITAAQIQAGSLTSSVIGNLGACLNQNPFFAGGSITGWTTSGSGNTVVVVPASSLTTPPLPGYGAQVTFVTAGASADKFNGSADRFGVIVGNKYAAVAWVYSSAAVTVNFGFEFRNSGGSPFSTLTSAFAVAANTWTIVNTVQAAPATSVTADLNFWTSAATTLSVQGAQAFPQIPGIVDATTITGAIINGGVFNGTNWIENSSGQFLYSGTPASGNLVVSIAPAAGTDGFGNAYKAGVTIYGTTGSTVQSTVVGSVAVTNLGTGDAAESSPGSLTTSTIGSGASRSIISVLRSPLVSGSSQVAQLQLQSQSVNLTSVQATASLDAPSIQLISSVNTSLVLGDNAGLTNSSFFVSAGGLAAVSNGFLLLWQQGASGRLVVGAGIVGFDPNSAGSNETWHNASLVGNFTAGTGTPRYRLEPNGAGLVRLDGTVNTTAATLANATMFTLPVGYRPSVSKRFEGVSSSSGYNAANPGTTLVQVLTTGVVQCVPVCNAGSQQIVLDGITFPVD